jgi:high-affinity nickel-transport protein
MTLGRSIAEAIRPRPSWIGIIGAIGLLHIMGWSILFALVVPRHLSIGATAFGAGTGLAAWLLGVRHAFDADHIAAIDNTIRKLMRAGQYPRSVGFWFSIGHSSVVFGLTLLLAFGLRDLSRLLLDGASPLRDLADVVGTLFSSGYLYAIATLNLVVLGDIWRMLSRARLGQCGEVDGRDRPGFMCWLLRPVMKLVSKPRHMCIVGFLFGLSFDTATEVALLVLASSSAATGLPWYAVLCLPVLFAAGMSLFDTIDSSLMTSAYSWAWVEPVRRLYYDLGLTALSAAIGFIVGTIEIAALIGGHLHGAPWWPLASIDLTGIGFLIVGLFAIVGLGAILARIYLRMMTAIASQLRD